MNPKWIEPYIDSSKKIIYEMTGIEISVIGIRKVVGDEFESYGVSSALTFSGKMKGRFIIDISPEAAMEMVFKIMGEKKENIKDKLFLACISEMNNTIAGDANTTLNDKYLLSLRLTPPVVFSGKNVQVATSKMEAVIVECSTEFGNLKLNIAIQEEV